MIKRIISILTIILYVFSSNISYADERIKMTFENGVYTMPCEVNGLRMKFIFDTGASMVSISMTEAKFMLKNGYINMEDFIGTAKTQIANGEIQENMKLILREVKLGNKTIYNVEALVSNSSTAPLLLGQSVIRQLGTWSIDNDHLVIRDSINNIDESTSSNIAEANRLYQKALEYCNLNDTINAITYLKKAAKLYINNGEQVSSFNCVSSIANLQDVTGIYCLGLFYFEGIGVKQDHKRALEFIEEAANRGYAPAQNYLGVCYKNGNGATQSYQQAVYWFEKAAEQGEADAQNNLGICYYNGNGVVQNYQDAIYWYNKAAEQGNVYAQYNLGTCYYYGNGVTQNYHQAVYWFEKAAEQSNSSAQYYLGFCYNYGQGIAQSYQQAFFWYKKAAEQGNVYAQYNLGYSYFEGNGVTQSYTEAVYWYKKAAEQRNADAQCNLGYCYKNGYGVTPNYQQAAYWYKQSAEQGNIIAQYNLGWCYYNGEGVPQSNKEAKYWFQKAADQGDHDAKIMLDKVH